MNRLPDVDVSDARWQLQERALGHGSRDAGDKALAFALRTLPSASPPDGFAAGVARAAAAVHLERAADDRADQLLLRALAVTMTVGAGVYALAYGRAWASRLASATSADAVGLGRVVAACLLASAVPWRHLLPRAPSQRTPG